MLWYSSFLASGTYGFKIRIQNLMPANSPSYDYVIIWIILYLPITSKSPSKREVPRMFVSTGDMLMSLFDALFSAKLKTNKMAKNQIQVRVFN